MSQVLKWKLVREIMPGPSNITPMEIHISQAEGTHVIGSIRGEFGDTRLESPYVSRNHCRLVFRNKYWCLEDTKSLNGTFLNGERIDCVRELRENDVIGLGVAEWLPTLAHPLSQYYLFRLIKYTRQVDSEFPLPGPASNSPSIPAPAPVVITLDDDDNETGTEGPDRHGHRSSCTSNSAVTALASSTVVRELTSDSTSSSPSTSTGASAVTVTVTPKTEKSEKLKTLSEGLRVRLMSHIAGKVPLLLKQQRRAAASRVGEERNQSAEQPSTSAAARANFGQEPALTIKNEDIGEEHGGQQNFSSETAAHRVDDETVNKKYAELNSRAAERTLKEQEIEKEARRKAQKQEEEEKILQKSKLQQEKEEAERKLKQEAEAEVQRKLKQDQEEKEQQLRLKQEQERQRKLKEIEEEKSRKLKEEEEREKQRKFMEEQEQEEEKRRKLREEQEEDQDEKQRKLEDEKEKEKRRKRREEEKRKQEQLKKDEEREKEKALTLKEEADRKKQRKLKIEEQERERKLGKEQDEKERRKLREEQEKRRMKESPGTSQGKQNSEGNRKSESHYNENELGRNLETPKGDKRIPLKAKEDQADAFRKAKSNDSDNERKESAGTQEDSRMKREEHAEKVRRMKALCAPMKLLLKPVVAFRENGEVIVKNKKSSLDKGSLRRIKRQFLESSDICAGGQIQHRVFSREDRATDKDMDKDKIQKKRRMRDEEPNQVPLKKIRNTEYSHHNTDQNSPGPSSSSSSFARKADQSSHPPKPKSSLQEKPPVLPMSHSDQTDSDSEDSTDLVMEVVEISPETKKKFTPEEDAAAKLSAIRERSLIQSRSVGTVKMLDYALPIRKKRSYESMESIHLPQPSAFRNSNQPSTSNSASVNSMPKETDRKEKLRQVAVQQQMEKKRKEEELKESRPASKAPAPVSIAKITTKSRSDLFVQDYVRTPAQAEPVPRRLPPAHPVRPEPGSGAPDHQMPLDKIKSAMDNNRLSQVIEKPNRPPIQRQVEQPESSRRQTYYIPPTPALDTGSSSSSRQRPPTEQEVRLAKSLGQPPRFIRSGSGQMVQVRPTPRPAEAVPAPRVPPTFQTRAPQAPLLRDSATPTPRFPDDAVYKDALSWAPNWLNEQGNHSKSPPVTGDRLVTTNLPAYKDYDSYTSVFYPLMLLELWSSISKDYNSQDDSHPRSYHSRPHHDRSCGQGKLEYAVGVERIESTHRCPILKYPHKSKRDSSGSGQGSSPTKNGGRAYWHRFHLTALAQNKGDFNRDRNFGTFTFDICVGGAVQRKSAFCFIFTEDERYEEIVPATIFHRSLVVNNTHKFKYTISLATYLKYETSGVVMDNPGVLKRISYITPKLRDFKALSLLPESKLFASVLQPPLPDRSEMFNPNQPVSPGYLVKRVYESLNPTQRGVIAHISKRILNHSDPDIMLLHGPPGTGKTRTIVALLLQLTQAMASKDNQKILVCTPSNTAIDEIIERYDKESKEADVKVVRIGNSSRPNLNKYSLDEVAKQYCAGASHVESLQRAIRIDDRKISISKAKIANLEINMKTDKSISSSALNNEKAAYHGLVQNRKMYANDLKKMTLFRSGMDKARSDAILKAQIIFSTLNSCSGGVIQKLNNAKRGDKNPMKFTCCIVDEATQATEPESLAPLILGCEKLVLVGDPNQLPATVLSAEAENRKFRQSLFTRLYNFYNEEENKDRSPVMMLTTQYRMHPEILAWPNQWFYDNKLQTSLTVVNDKLRDIRVQPYLFLNISSQEDQSDKGQISNIEEVKLIREILFVLQHQFNIDSRNLDLSIGIITPYNDQKKKIIQEISAEKALCPDFWNRIEVDTVDSYQGREKDIILLSCVRTDEMGFLKTRERLNVSITRAKMSLIILGNAPCLNNDLMWKSLMDNAAERGVFNRIPPDYKAKGNGYLKQWIERTILINRK